MFCLPTLSTKTNQTFGLDKLDSVIIFGAIFSLFMIIPNEKADARPCRPPLIPNGNINSCLNCHVTSFGGPRNTFGNSVAPLVAPGGCGQFWNSTLAALDSDGDGFTNGEELQDPSGSWTSGDPNPGNPALVSNPGDASSVPPAVDTPTATPTATQAPEETETPTPTETPGLPPFPDYDENNEVNEVDLLLFMNGRINGATEVDLEADGENDYKDIFYFSTQWLNALFVINENKE